nr:transposon Ty3-I Gag-Pol polyprotein [Tanacetum cinerariifolium]
MYHDLKQHFWWSGMKRDVATFVSRCLICQQVKIEHQRASGLLQPLDIAVWKWDEILMDFVIGLPRTQRRHDAIWVVVDRLTKSVHFLPIRKDYSVSKLAETFQQEIVRLHGTPSAITDGQTERTIQTLEDMLRSYALEWTGNWDDYICLVEFAYNNSWHASVRCAPFEMLYGVPLLRCYMVGNAVLRFVGIRGYKYHPLHVISYPLDQIQTNLSYVKEPEAILDHQDRVMRKKTIPFIKILWRNHPEWEATWETEE